MSRLDVGLFIADVLRELPDVPESVKAAIAGATQAPENKRVAAIREAIEKESRTGASRDRRARHG